MGQRKGYKQTVAHIEKTRQHLMGKPSRNRKPDGVAARNSLHRIYKMSAAKRNLPFEISKDRFIFLIQQACESCGVPPFKMYKSNYKNCVPCFYNGVDRIDNSQGYIEGNVRPFCFDCNQAKHNKSEEQFNNWISRLLKFRVKETNASN